MPAGPDGAPEQRAPPGGGAVCTLDLRVVQARRQIACIHLGNATTKLAAGLSASSSNRARDADIGNDAMHNKALKDFCHA